MDYAPDSSDERERWYVPRDQLQAVDREHDRGLKALPVRLGTDGSGRYKR